MNKKEMGITLIIQRDFVTNQYRLSAHSNQFKELNSKISTEIYDINFIDGKIDASNVLENYSGALSIIFETEPSLHFFQHLGVVINLEQTKKLISFLNTIVELYEKYPDNVCGKLELC